MKTRALSLAVIFLVVTLIATSCRSSRNGCPSTRYSGERFKATKFSWE